MDQDARPARRFSYDEAARLLPQVRKITAKAHETIEALILEADSTKRPRELARESIDQLVSGWVREIRALGVEVKGLWLVDFDNGSGYYCWQWPEEGLHFYHSHEDGLAGRMRIQ